MTFEQFYSKVFAIMRIEGNQAKVVGSGFLVSTNPVKLMTCHHVVSQATESNDGTIQYAITKRTDNFTDFDLRAGQATWLRISRIQNFPQYDLAILIVDPNENVAHFASLHIPSATAFELNFNEADRIFGTGIEWLSTAAQGDIRMVPRFFRGCVVSSYITDQRYNCPDVAGTNQVQQMNGVRMFEVDRLFIPGCSGSPILNSEVNQVIGFVHGFNSWPIETSTDIEQKVVATEEDGQEHNLKLKQKQILVSSLSMAIDLRTVKEILVEQQIIPAEPT